MLSSQELDDLIKIIKKCYNEIMGIITKTKKKRVVIIILIIILIFILSFFIIKAVEAPSLFNEKVDKQELNQKNNQLNSLPAIKEDVKPEIKIIFTGDIMLSRTVNAKMEKYKDYTWPFLKVADFLNQADFVVGNLESPFLKNSSSYQVLTGSFSFKANPLSIQGLKLANFSLLSLANNHTINQGKQGIVDTIDILTENNINFVGAGLNKEESRKPVIINLRGYNFAFLAYAYPEDASVATENRAGINNMDKENMEEDVSLLKKIKDLDFIIILMHAGTEYVLEPNWQQKEFARAAIEAGADMVVGHHPHWPQIFEFYQDKPIIYSLGNFVFDQMWSEETKQGLLLKMTWQNELKELELIPTKIYDYGQVEILATSTERSLILKKIKASDEGIIFQKTNENN